MLVIGLLALWIVAIIYISVIASIIFFLVAGILLIVLPHTKGKAATEVTFWLLVLALALFLIEICVTLGAMISALPCENLGGTCSNDFAWMIGLVLGTTLAIVSIVIAIVQRKAIKLALAVRPMITTTFGIIFCISAVAIVVGSMAYIVS